jgi:hypothetical protein
MENSISYLTALNNINDSALNIVADSPASIFSKSDVAFIIGNVIKQAKEHYNEHVEIPSGFSREDIQEVVKIAFNEMNHLRYMKTDNDSAQFDLSYNNKIELSEVDIEFKDEDFLSVLNKNILDGLDALEEQSK